MIKNLVVWFKDVDKGDIPLVVVKGRIWCEMIQAGFPVPNGFIVQQCILSVILKKIIGRKIRHLINATTFDDTKSLNNAYKAYQKNYHARKSF